MVKAKLDTPNIENPNEPQEGAQVAEQAMIPGPEQHKAAAEPTPENRLEATNTLRFLFSLCIVLDTICYIIRTTAIYFLFQ